MKEILRDLLKYGESTWLDWKADFPDGLIWKAKDPQWEKGKGTLLKDMVAIANSEDERNGFLVYGVADDGGKRTVKGTSQVAFDDADLQQWVENTFDPPFDFLVSNIEMDSGKIITAVTIKHSPMYPHVTRRDVGGVIHAGQVWYRRGSKNTVALHNEMKLMFLGSPPIRVAKDNDRMVDETRAHYESQGRITIFPRLADQDSKLAEQYEFAYYPGSRRKIVLVNCSNEDECVLMLKKR